MAACAGRSIYAASSSSFLYLAGCSYNPELCIIYERAFLHRIPTRLPTRMLWKILKTLSRTFSHTLILEDVTSENKARFSYISLRGGWIPTLHLKFFGSFFWRLTWQNDESNVPGPPQPLAWCFPFFDLPHRYLKNGLNDISSISLAFTVLMAILRR